jgi:hypothetical protein
MVALKLYGFERSERGASFFFSARGNIVPDLYIYIYIYIYIYMVKNFLLEAAFVWQQVFQACFFLKTQKPQTLHNF